MIRGDTLYIKENKLNVLPKAPYVNEQEENETDEEYAALQSSFYFRRKCLDQGYRILSLYPVYHQGWEMDEWGAIGAKDGKAFRLETNHGALEITPNEGFSILTLLKNLFK